MRSSAASPLLAVSQVMPSTDSRRWPTIRFTGLSSTSSTRAARTGAAGEEGMWVWAMAVVSLGSGVVAKLPPRRAARRSASGACRLRSVTLRCSSSGTGSSPYRQTSLRSP